MEPAMVENNPSNERVSVDEQRAEWERMTLVVCENGVVNVRNDSYGDESSHTYSVHLDDNEPVRCTCKHYKYRSPEGGCKHMRKVGQSPIVTASASAASASYNQVATDGGQITEHKYDSPKVTIHREPEGVGGALFGRCENCGVECVADHDGHISILHEKSCPGDSNPDEIDETPL